MTHSPINSRHNYCNSIGKPQKAKVRFFQATYHEYNAVTNSKQVERTVNIWVREEDTRLMPQTN